MVTIQFPDYRGKTSEVQIPDDVFDRILSAANQHFAELLVQEGSSFPNLDQRANAQALDIRARRA